MLTTARGFAAPHPQTQATFEDVVEVLRLGLSPATDGHHHANLMSLRALGDPTLTPLFLSLVQSSDWASRIDGVLGAAEANTPPAVDPFLLAALPSNDDRIQALQSALGLGLVTPAVAAECLKWEGVPDLDRLVLMAVAQQADSKSIDSAFVKGKLGDENSAVDALAAVLMFVQGDASGWAKFTARLETLEKPARQQLIAETAQAAVAYKLPLIAPRLMPLSLSLGVDPPTERIVSAALFALKDPKALDTWKAMIARHSARRDRLKDALVLLAEGPLAGSEGVSSLLGAEDDLLVAMGQALEKRDTELERAQFVAALMTTGHVQSTEAAIVMANRMTASDSEVIWRTMLESGRAPSVAPALRSAAVSAAIMLARANPAIVSAMAAGSDDRFQESCAFALLRAGSKDAAEAAAAMRGSLSRRADALALMAMASAELPMSEIDMTSLVRAAAGGADLDAVLQVQAAWIVARRQGRIDEVLAALVRPTPSNP